jgi:hypothetical protein
VRYHRRVEMDRERGVSDRRRASGLALVAADGDRSEAALLVDSAWRAARTTLETARAWASVEAVAAALLAARTLDGAAFRRLCAR